jgi:acyl carrier protein
MRDVRSCLEVIFRDVLDDPTVVLSDGLAVGSHPGWDSVATIQIVLAAEADLGVRLTTDEVATLRTAPDVVEAFERALARRA